jgi:phosphonate degradation associated HDIG domain protein
VALTVEQITQLYASRGAVQYGSEAVSQLEHALQCAALAQQAGSGPELVAAAFLHDFGHLVADRPHENGRELDDAHQYLAIPFLRGLFPAAVLEPIRLHVDAKRYLCRAEPAYRDTLSAASKHSLELQGGVYTQAEAARFFVRPYAPEAVALRRWDDLAKVQGRMTPTLGELAQLLGHVAVTNAQ